MLNIGATLLAEQKKFNRSPPNIKLEFAPFDYPDAPSIIRFNQYDWRKVHENNHAWTAGASACCASDGSFIIWDGTNAPVRFANPSYSTDWSSWHAEEVLAPGTITYPAGYKIIASPIDGEVMCFGIAPDNYTFFECSGTVTTYDPNYPKNIIDNSANFPTGGNAYLYYGIKWHDGEGRIANIGSSTLAYITVDSGNPPSNGDAYTIYGAVGTVGWKRSTDYGATFGNWTCTRLLKPYAYFSTESPNMLTACYKPNGDIAIMAWKQNISAMVCNKRISGVWYTSGGFTHETSGGDLGWSKIGSTEGLASMSGGGCDMVYEDDFLIIYTGTLVGELKYTIYGDGGEYTDRWIMDVSEVSRANIETELNSFSDATYFNTTERISSSWEIIYQEIALCDTRGKTDLDLSPAGSAYMRYLSRIQTAYRHGYGTLGGGGRENALMQHLRMVGEKQQGVWWTGTKSWIDEITSSLHPYLIKITGHPIILSNCDSEDIYFLRRREDTDFVGATFGSAFKLTNPHSLAMCANSEYIFAYNGNQIYMSPLPNYWSTPTAGTGMGDNRTVTTDTSRVLFSQEQKIDGVSTIDIFLDNHDSYYDDKGIIKGDICRFYEGFDINGTPTYYESKRYVVDSVGYTREPNNKMCIIRCVDAWRLLEEYIFPVQVNFNQYTDDYTVYEIIEMLVEAIGGTLTSSSKSAEIDAIYPIISLRAGARASDLLRRLLAIVRDVIKFNGLTGTILYPQASDSAAYTYKFPLSTEGTYHPILWKPDLRNSESTDNVIVVIGSDRSTGDLVFGQTGSGRFPLVLSDTMIGNQTDAQSISTYLNTKQRIVEALGNITIPANIGTELWDVIAIEDDSYLDGASTKFRIGGYSEVYDKMGGKNFRQVLILVGV